MRCGIVGMGTRSVEANQENTATIAHVPTGIVHELPHTGSRLEKEPPRQTVIAPPSTTIEVPLPAFLSQARLSVIEPCDVDWRPSHPGGPHVPRKAPGLRRAGLDD